MTRTLSTSESLAYAPLAVGDAWIYQGLRTITLAGNTSTVELQRRRTVSGAMSVDGVDALVVWEFGADGTANVGDVYFTASPAGLTQVGILSTAYVPTDVASVPPLPPFLQVAFPIQTCSTFSQYATTTPSGDRLTSSAVERSLEARVVGARTFTDALHVERTQVASYANPRGSPNVLHIGSNDWYAPEFGLIESHIDFADPPQTYDYQLIGSHVNGVNHGVLPLGALAAVASPSANPDDRSAVASDGTRFLLVQTTTMSLLGGLRLVFLDGEGIPQSATSISAGVGAPVQPTATYGNGQYLITFREANVLSGLLVSATDGTPIGAPFEITSNLGLAGVAVAFAQDRFMVATIQSQRVAVETIDAQGRAGGPVQPYPATIQIQDAPAIASDGSNLLLVWQTESPTAIGFQPTAIQAGRIDDNGRALDAQVTPVSITTGTEEQASVVFDGTRYVIAWFHRPDASLLDEGTIFAARIGTDGTDLDPAGRLIPTTTRAKTGLRIGRVGSQAILTWYASGQDLAGGNPGVARIAATRLDGNAMSLDSSATQEGLWVSQQQLNGGELQLPEIAAAGDRSLVVYVDRSGEAQMTRLFAGSLLFPW